LRALRLIRDRFTIGPDRCFDAFAQMDKFRSWNIHMKPTDRASVTCLLTRRGEQRIICSPGEILPSGDGWSFFS
jgi:hypothetical protein